jgi:uncharacterized sodium:solute symporter family permease YidK
MRIDQNPLFRKSISPWYDSETVCIGIVIFMLVVFVFGCIGISVAREEAEFHGYVWIAILLLVMSGGVILSIIARLIKRHASRASK